MTANKFLRELYLDYRNNYLTVERMSEHHNVKPLEMVQLLKLGEDMHEEYVKAFKSPVPTLIQDALEDINHAKLQS